MLATLGATVLYEGRMAARGRAVWLSMAPFLLLGLVVASAPLTGEFGAAENVGAMAQAMSMLISIAAGVAMADRFKRGRAVGLEDLLSSTPLSIGGRLVGCLTGSLALALAPVAALMLALGVYVWALTGNALAPLWALAAFAAVVLPAALWAGALSATAGLVLPVPAVRVAIVPVLLWASWWNRTLVPLPTPTGTVLSPSGEYAGAAWFSTAASWAGQGRPTWLSPDPATGSALLNLGCVLLTVALLLGAARLIFEWKR